MHIEDVNKLISGTLGALRAKRLIGELHDCRLIVRRLHHAVELGLLAAFLRGLQFARAVA